MDNCYNIKDIFNDMFIDIVDIKYFWIFNIVNLIGVIICWVISYNYEEKIVSILITIFFIASIISDFTDDIYFYTVNVFCLVLIIAYIIYANILNIKIKLSGHDPQKVKKELQAMKQAKKQGIILQDNDAIVDDDVVVDYDRNKNALNTRAETDTSRFYNLSDSRSNSNKWLD